MHFRCYDDRHIGWKYYGGRGIKVCNEWHNFESFYVWAIATKYAPGLSIERVNGDKNYSPVNCSWATRKQQARNRKTNIHATINGETKTVAEWIEEKNISRHLVYKRISYGWSTERAITQPHRLAS